MLTSLQKKYWYAQLHFFFNTEEQKKKGEREVYFKKSSREEPDLCGYQEQYIVF